MNRGLRLLAAGAVVFALAGDVLPADPATVRAQTPPAKKGLVGTWRVQVTLYNCSTGVEQPPFWSLVTFATSGTATETTANQALPATRTSGHGVWEMASGGSYTAVTEAFLLFGPTVRSWTQRISQQIEMLSDDEFTSDASVEFALTPGSLPPPPIPLPPAAGCARAVGRRF